MLYLLVLVTLLWEIKMVFKSFLSKAKDIDILASIPDGIMLVGYDGKIEWINDVIPILFRMNKNEVFKISINEIIESGLDLIRQAADNFKSVVGRVKIQSGKDTYLEITAKPIESYFVVSLRDVTQNYKTVTNILVEHECSKKVNKDKNNFLVKLSNELKSPLTSVIGFSQAMVDGLGGKMTDKQEKYVKIINKNSGELLYLINKIIELAKTESNLFEYDFQIFDAVNTIQAVIKENEPAIKAKNLTVSVNSDEILKKTIFSDEGALKVILQNIIEAAITSTDIGSISIKSYHPDAETVAQQNLDVAEEYNEKKYMMIEITDTGAGFIESDLGVAFEPYSQLEKINKKNIVRSIALASAKNLVRYLKGALWIESEPMQGATYNIIIPTERIS